eukprot:TRINITY_DN3652_c0_g1_i1.p1 TRINITY_DN3652_c0_g1~~TRINITY_DN3652_c0_g1_i1.p1  ORF type:complete len:105 (+),score=26.19 TRINITY_DN3652_c0_g1_i1:84-398(+)
MWKKVFFFCVIFLLAVGSLASEKASRSSHLATALNRGSGPVKSASSNVQLVAYAHDKDDSDDESELPDGNENGDHVRIVCVGGCFPGHAPITPQPDLDDEEDTF